MNITKTYHVIDFLLPAQRFNINFSYITQKGLPFTREYILRLIHLAPMSKLQVATYFGFTPREADEAIDDLIGRDDLTLSVSGRLTLTDKSAGYFMDVGEVPRLSILQDCTANLVFDLATFTCHGKGNLNDKWKSGISIEIDNAAASESEKHVEKNFQRHFHDILQKDYLSKSLTKDEKDSPEIYVVNSVHKVKSLPIRLSVEFKLDSDGRAVEREDFESLIDSNYVQSQITQGISNLARPNNFSDMVNAMFEIGDADSLKIFDSKCKYINLQFLEDILKLESNSNDKRTTIVGPIYSPDNWVLVQKHLAPIINSRRENKSDFSGSPLIWIAPSDPYWGKCQKIQSCVSDICSLAKHGDKSIYSPIVYLPISDATDNRSVQDWKREFDHNLANIKCIAEGFLRGNIEVMHLEGEFVVVIYHFSIPTSYPVTLPFGFISSNKDTVAIVGRLVKSYIEGSAGFDKPNDLGFIARMTKSR